MSKGKNSDKTKSTAKMITVLVELEEDADDTKRGLVRGTAEVVAKDIPINVLRKNLTAVCSQVQEFLQDVRDVGRFKLAEVTFQVEVSATGGIHLVGSATVGGKGSITLKFLSPEAKKS